MLNKMVYIKGQKNLFTNLLYSTQMNVYLFHKVQSSDGRKQVDYEMVINHVLRVQFKSLQVVLCEIHRQLVVNEWN